MPDAILDACAASSLLYFAAVLKPTRVLLEPSKAALTDMT